jgi:hypothetical protein
MTFTQPPLIAAEIALCLRSPPATPDSARYRAIYIRSDAGRVAEIWLQPNAALRQSTAFEADHAAVATCIRAGQDRAQAADLAESDQSALRDLVPNLVSMTRVPATDALLRARHSLATVGVALVFAPEATCLRNARNFDGGAGSCTTR